MFGYFRTLLHLPKAVHFYLLSEMLFGIGIGMGVILNFHYLGLGFDTAVIGKALAANSVIVAVCSYPAGIFSDRYGAKLAMVIGSGIIALGYVFLSFISTPLELYLAQTVLAVGFAFVISCEFPYIMSLCERKEDETTAYNMLIAAFTLTMSLGNILGTKLPTMMPAGNTKYQTTMFLIAVAFFLMWVMRIFLPAKSKRVAKAEQGKPKSGGWKVVPSRQVMIYVIFATINGFIWSIVVPFENVIMRERFTMSDDTIGYVLAVNSFLIFLISLFTPYLMRTGGRRFFLYAGFVTLLAMMLGMGFQVTVYAFTVFLLGKGTSSVLVNSFIDSSMLKATADEERGLHSGLRNLTRAGAGAIASSYGGYLIAGGDTHSVYFIAFLAIAILIGYYLLFVRHQLTHDLEERF